MGINLGIGNIIEFLVLLGQQCLYIEHNCVSARVFEWHIVLRTRHQIDLKLADIYQRHQLITVLNVSQLQCGALKRAQFSVARATKSKECVCVSV